MYSSKNLLKFGPFAFSNTSIVGYFEKGQYMQESEYLDPFSVVMGPPKSMCVFSLGSEQFIKSFQFDAGLIGLRFLPISVQRLALSSLVQDFAMHVRPERVLSNV